MQSPLQKWEVRNCVSGKRDQTPRGLIIWNVQKINRTLAMTRKKEASKRRKDTAADGNGPQRKMATTWPNMAPNQLNPIKNRSSIWAHWGAAEGSLPGEEGQGPAQQTGDSIGPSARRSAHTPSTRSSVVLATKKRCWLAPALCIPAVPFAHSPSSTQTFPSTTLCSSTTHFSTTDPSTHCDKPLAISETKSSSVLTHRWQQTYGRLKVLNVELIRLISRFLILKTN